MMIQTERSDYEDGEMVLKNDINVITLIVMKFPTMKSSKNYK